MRTSFKMVLFILLLAGCGQQEAEHAHDETGIVPLSFTHYSKNTELFVEFNPMIVGKFSGFAAHFTILGQKFIPLTEGSVTVSLIINDKGIKSSSDSASSPGIYRLGLKPIASGKGKLIFDIVTKDYTDQIVINDVTVYPDEESALSQIKAVDSGNEITFLKEQAWNIEFSNAPVRRDPFREILKTSGQLLPAPGDESVITANSNGAVLFATNKTVIGSEIKTGDHLFTISSGNLTQGNPEVYYNETKAKYELSKAEFERAAILVKDKIISQKEYLQTKLEYENMEANFQAVSKNYSRTGQKISSNSSGFLKNLLVTEGQYVEAGIPLAVVSKNKKVLLQANVSQKYYNKLPNISAANFRIISEDKVFDSENMNGKVVSYGKSASSNASFIPITFEIDNIGNIIPGAIAEVFLKSSPIPDALVIPVSALMEELGNFYVFVQTGGESFQKREVKLAGNDGIQVHVISGLMENERVVTKGAYAIKLASATGAVPEHGHSH
ncbi:efflux RND transporter periplasmic adaptor subunit [Aquiflexum sp.]|uniref:efflux RND transporter periplasmic adaptor subunit n=1 Tax=Aquiflexum sp. TaxID=1872584 RepID=UPI0035944237